MISNGSSFEKDFLSNTFSLVESMTSTTISFSDVFVTFNVEFLGFKKGEELQSLIQNASYVIVPSECYENNPMSIIEAYMNGTPVIGSRLGGIPELIVENKTGYTFQSKSTENLKDVIEKACSITAEEYTRMSAAAKRFALENFSEESHYNQLMKNYQLVIDMKKG